MILPIIEYGDIFLVGATAANRKKLEILQNKGLRCALNRDRDSSVKDLHIIAGLQRLKGRRDRHVLSHMYDMAQQDRYLKKKRKTGVQTRSHKKKLLKIKKPITEKFKKMECPACRLALH